MSKALALVAALLAASPSLAREVPPVPASTLALELNAVQPSETGCRVSFLATNNLGAALDRASVEMAWFDGAGTITRIVTLDFTALSPGKTKVLQFELGALDCADIGRVLVNDITACEGADLAADACLAGLVTTTRAAVNFGV